MQRHKNHIHYESGKFTAGRPLPAVCSVVLPSESPGGCNGLKILILFANLILNLISLIFPGYFLHP